MFKPLRRRGFLGGLAAGGTLMGLGDFSFLAGLPAVSAADAQLDPKVVRLEPEIEPLVRLLEDTPRERLLEEVSARIHKGLSYRELLAALLLAGVRNVQPRPHVGFKFHAVLVVNSAHLASLSSPDSERWLPIFWALDYFKSAQAATQKESGWRMAPVDETSVPPAGKARQAFLDAMNNWDEQAADVAVAGLARTAGAQEVFELFCRLGARDFRDIGHKAIFVANSWRTLQCIGWQHAEPVLRSLAYALLMHEGDNPAKRDDPADRPGRRNLELARKVPESWLDGKISSLATADLVGTLREGSENEVCDKVLELLQRGIGPQSIWDGLYTGAGELLLRQPGIVGLHTITTTNALRYGFEASGNDETRRLMLLQTAAFLPMFRQDMKRRGKVGEQRLDQLDAAPLQASPAEALTEIFADINRDRMNAARKTLAYLQDSKDSVTRARDMLDRARVLIFLKGTDSHDYKFSSAVFEDYLGVSPGRRERFLAASVVQLRGSGSPDNPLVRRTRAALKS